MIRLILTDVDGTLTFDRDTYNIDLDAVDLLRKVEKKGIKVGLVSGNSYPVLRALYTYFGFNGGIVAENGCIVYFHNQLKEVCERVDRNLISEFENKFGVKGSWQNRFKVCDFSFYPPILKDEMVRWALDKGLYIKTSGYAVHISKSKRGKAEGVRELIKMHGLDKAEVVGIGDSSTDIEFLEEVGIRVVVGNADESLKSIGDFVMREKSGKAVVEFIKKVITGEINE
ncbi:phosphoglycolate phosphatase [Sulfolobus acidocaldarius SUSAZ]|nr:phosphoglycolate phosphatase [Sulfolobus acidocaldarius SUSAZ]